MAKALYTSKDGYKLGKFELGKHGAGTGSVNQNVSDGDTVNLKTPLNIASRFLGIDAPEKGLYKRPDDSKYVPITDAAWTTFFTSGEWKNGINLPPALQNHLQARIGNGTKVATNHAFHAAEATKELERLIKDDLADSGKTKEEFQFFLAFGDEFMDGYGRLLCYLHADKDNWSPAKSKVSYNQRMLETGHALPYFIFPNVQPFLRVNPFSATNVAPAGFWALVSGATNLQKARAAVAASRTAKRGVFDASNPLILEAFELRYLSRAGSNGPDRYVINLGAANGNTILRPEKYYSIPKAEDRLFIPAQFVPLFKENGWQVA
jgi:endonuclease YncB( thermonuclease family)/uncharacterized protein YegP (UPF0339 family)